MLVLLAVVSIANAAPCERVSSDALRRGLEAGELARWGQSHAEPGSAPAEEADLPVADPGGLAAAAVRVRSDVGCLVEPLTPDDARRVHQLLAWAAVDEAARAAHTRAVVSIGETTEALLAGRQPAVAATDGRLPLPALGRVAVDGSEQLHTYPTDRAWVFQRTQNHRIAQTELRLPDERRPAYLTRSAAFGIGAGLSAAGSLACLMGAAGTRAAWGAEQASDSPDVATLIGLQRANHGLAYAGVGLGALAATGGAVALSFAF